MKVITKIGRLVPLGSIGLMILTGGGAFADAIYTTNKTATIVNANVQYGLSTDVYLSGGPQNTKASGPADGVYYFQVTDPSGRVLLSSDNAACRQLQVTGGRVVGTPLGAPACKHAIGTTNPNNGVTAVQLAPFSATPNAGGEYKAWIIPVGQATVCADLNSLTFPKSSASTDNFKVPAGQVIQGSCQPSSSLSAMVQGTNVVSYVPKAHWSASSPTGVSVINVEGSRISPTLISTPKAVNSCASNPVTGQTVCTANDTDVYLLTGTTLGSTLTSGGAGVIGFSGGACTNCGVAMDATHNKALIGLSIAGVAGFQFLNLSSSTFEPAVISPSGAISEDPLIDPIRNLLLSPAQNGEYEIANVATTPAPQFFENSVGGELDSAGEDCTTGIALAPAEFSGPSNVYIADLTQATFTAGTPGTWTTTGSQVQTLSESFLSAGASGIAVAQNTHIGVVSGEFGGDTLPAITLPSTVGSGP